MAFEYVQIRYAGEQFRSFVSEPELIGRSIVEITDGHICGDMKVWRAKLSKLTSSAFEMLTDIEQVPDLSHVPQLGEVQKKVWPVIKFQLDDVRFAVSNLIDDANRIAAKLHRDHYSAHRHLLPPCPPHDIDGAIHWIIERELFKYRPDHVDGPQFWGTPMEMYQTLSAILHDNINYQLGVLQDVKDPKGDGDEWVTYN